jgi:hypothetical protein
MGVPAALLLLSLLVLGCAALRGAPPGLAA